MPVMYKGYKTPKHYHVFGNLISNSVINRFLENFNSMIESTSFMVLYFITYILNILKDKFTILFHLE